MKNLFWLSVVVINVMGCAKEMSQLETTSFSSNNEYQQFEIQDHALSRSTNASENSQSDLSVFVREKRNPNTRLPQDYLVTARDEEGDLDHYITIDSFELISNEKANTETKVKLVRCTRNRLHTVEKNSCPSGFTYEGHAWVYASQTFGHSVPLFLIPYSAESSSLKLKLISTFRPAFLPDDTNLFDFRVGYVKIPDSVEPMLGFSNLSDSKLYQSDLPKRIYSQWQNVVSSKAEWLALSDFRKKFTLYWDAHQLIAEKSTGEKAIIDDQSQFFDFYRGTASEGRYPSMAPYLPVLPSENEGLLIAASKNETYLPICAFVSPYTHILHCQQRPENAHIENRVFSFFPGFELERTPSWSGSQVISLRFQVENYDVHLVKNLKDSQGRPLTNLFPHSLNPKVLRGIRNTGDFEDFVKTPFYVESSISKIPGDFSERACKTFSYQVATGITEMEQFDMDGRQIKKSRVCKFNSNKLKNYYFNIRLVHINSASGNSIKRVTKASCLKTARVGESGFCQIRASATIHGGG